jgi:hypothetical protein
MSDAETDADPVDETTDTPQPRYPNEMARRVATAIGLSTRRPPNKSPGPRSRGHR